MDKKEYGVIHEIGDYYHFKPVSKEDNEKLNEQFNSTKEKDKDNQKK